MSLVVAIPGLPDSKRCADWKYHPRYLDGSALPLALGMNGMTALAYSLEMPFLNALKWAGGKIWNHPWLTVNQNYIGAPSTAEEAYLQVDANGYPTSLVAGNGFSGTQQFTYAQTVLYENYNNGLAPGQTYYYPNGSHTVTYSGTGTIVVDENGVSTTITASGQTFNSSGLSNGIAITITATDPNKVGDYVRDIAVVQTAQLANYQAGAIFRPEWLAMMAGIKCFRGMQWGLQDDIYLPIAFTVSPQASATSAIMCGQWNGQIQELTAAPAQGATNATLTYAWAGTTGSYLLQFSDGETRTVTLINGQTSCDWSTGGGPLTSAVGAWPYIVPQLTAAPGSGAKSGTLTEPWWGNTGSYTVIFSDGTEQPVSLTKGQTGISWPTGVGAGLSATITIGTPWTQSARGAYNVVLANGVTVSASFTPGSAKITWTGGLAAAASDLLAYVLGPGDGTWANRPQTTLVSYAFRGVPYEIMIAAANALDADAWLNVRIDADDNHITQLCTLANSTLGADRRYHVEYSNEVWNSVYYQCSIAAYYGATAFGYASGLGSSGYANPTLVDNWVGKRCAEIADLCATACGAAFDRCYPVISSQTGNPSRFDTVMTTPLWGTDSPQNHPVKDVALAPYWGGKFTTADATTILAVSVPLDDFFQLFTGDVGTVANGSKSYPGVGAGGWVAANQSNITAILAKFTGSSGYKTKVGAIPYTPQLVCYEWGPAFYSDDSSNGGVVGIGNLITSAMRDSRMGTVIQQQLEWWKTTVGAGPENVVCFFTDVTPPSKYGDFGVLESLMQPVSPAASAPAKWQGVQNYIANG